MEAQCGKNRKQSSNFTKEEELLLVNEVEKYKGVIECKTTDKANNFEKNEAWRKIAEEFNSKEPFKAARSTDQLKSKYENLKTKARKFAAEIRDYYNRTGGGPSKKPEWDPVTEAVLRLLNEKTVIGFENPNDSDAACNIHQAMRKENVEDNSPDIEELIVLDPIVLSEGNTDEISVENFDAIPSSSKDDISPKQTVESMCTKNTISVTSLGKDWSRYSSVKLRTPVNKKLRPVVPISKSLHLAKEEYYKQKQMLIEEDIKFRKLEREDRERKRQREEEEHEVKMKILQCELKFKQKELEK